MRVIFLLALIVASSARAELNENETSSDPKVIVNWVLEPVVYEESYDSQRYVPTKEESLVNGYHLNSIACAKRKGKVVGRPILHRYHKWHVGAGQQSLDYRVISVCRFPEIKEVRFKNEK